MASYITSGFNFLNYSVLGKSALCAVDLGLVSYLLGKQENYLSVVQSRIQERIKLANLNDPNQRYANVSKDVELKLRALVVKQNVDPERITFIIDKENLLSKYSASGSLKYNEKSLILISSPEYKKLEDSQDLPKSSLFAITHELGHIVNDDTGNAGKRQHQIDKICGCATYLFTSYYCCFSGWGYLSAGAMGHLASYSFSRLVIDRMTQKMEVNADEFASHDLDTCKGAVKYFKKSQKENLLERDKFFQSFPAFDSKLTRFLIRSLVIDDEGNNLLDREHPLLTERIAFFQSKIDSYQSRF